MGDLFLFCGEVVDGEGGRRGIISIGLIHSVWDGGGNV